MKLKQIIQRLQEIKAKYNRDLDVFIVAEPGIVSISDIVLMSIFEENKECSKMFRR